MSVSKTVGSSKSRLGVFLLEACNQHVLSWFAEKVRDTALVKDQLALQSL